MERKKIRLLAVDLDGTLIRENGIAQADVQALKEAIERGVTVCIATGRPHRSALMVLGEAGLGELPVISFNGAMIRVPGMQEPLLHRTLPLHLAREVVHAAVERRWDIQYFVGDDCYIARMSKMGWLYWQRTGVRPTPVGDLRKIADREPTKIIVTGEPARLDLIAPQVVELWGEKLFVARSRPDIIEIASPLVNKGHALVQLARHLNIDIAQTMAIGDAANDVALVEAAGIGVAMPNSDSEVMRVADIVLEDSEAPIAEALSRYVL
jgi:Cof subfamily protein (haloacid dehalogenase superfamily)